MSDPKHTPDQLQKLIAEQRALETEQVEMQKLITEMQRRSKYPELWDGCVGFWHPAMPDPARMLVVLSDVSGNNHHGTFIGGER